MKKLLTIVAIATLSIVAARAQSNAPANPVQNFATTVQQYFTDLNTNYTWTNVTVEIASGYKQVTGANAASTLDVQYDFAKSFNAGISFQFSGIGSAINGAEAQIGYTLLEKSDTKLDADLLAGWDNTRLDSKGQNGAFEVEPQVALEKKMTPNTFARTALSFPIFTTGRFNTQPTIKAEVGFTF